MRDTIAKYMQDINKIVTYAYPDTLEILRVVKTGGKLFEVIAESNYQIVACASSPADLQQLYQTHPVHH